MKRPLLILSAVAAALACLPISSAEAGSGIGCGHGGARLSVSRHGHGRGHGFGKGHGHKVSLGFKHGFGQGFGAGVFIDDDDSDLADLYRELLDNVPYFALHPPVYYSYPVPRTYGYSPFAYGPWVMTPELAAPPEPVTIINPYVPNAQQKASLETKDRSAKAHAQPEPLVIINPYVTPNQAVARSGQ